MCAEVESLIRAHERAATFIENPAVLTRDARAGVSEELELRRFGPYEVIRQLGRGGMGVVYLAARADAEYSKQVAVKVIQTQFGGETLIERFRRERQILAGLEHPNIARLLDGGTTEQGWPYLVMEYVYGPPITLFAEERNLGVRDRLHLFQDVCAAVQFAHRNLVLHRDIKPGNILVTDEGVPKLLDFGISRLLSADSDRPEDPFTRLLCTPDYASPEQLRGQALGTSSDVYLLGVLLFELLTGRNPHCLHGTSTHDIVRAVCEEEPERPSVVAADATGVVREFRKWLAGDLDAIVLKAMAKEPERRYGSAEQLAEDVRRWLGNQPVSAMKPTWSYRTFKLIKRQKAAVVAGTTAVLMLVSGIVATSWQARIATIERARADQRFAEVRQLTTSFLFEFHDAIQNLPGATKARELVVKRALEHLDRLAGDSSNDRKLSLELVEAYKKVGDVQGRPMFANLGDTPGALTSYRKAESLLRGLLARDSQDAITRKALLVVRQRLGDTLLKVGEAATGLEAQREALDIATSLVASDPLGYAALLDLSIAHDRIGRTLQSMGDNAAALKSFRSALEVGDKLASLHPLKPDVHRGLMIQQTKIGILLGETGSQAEALEYYLKAQAIAERIAAADSTNAQAKRDLSIVWGWVADAHFKLGRVERALEIYRKAQTIAEELAAADPDDVQAKNDVAEGHKTLGDWLESRGETQAALQHYIKAATIAESTMRTDASDRELRSMVGDIYKRLGALNSKLGRSSESRSWYDKAEELARHAPEKSGPH